MVRAFKIINIEGHKMKDYILKKYRNFKRIETIWLKEELLLNQSEFKSLYGTLPEYLSLEDFADTINRAFS